MSPAATTAAPPVANARMYSVTPAAAAAWRTLFTWLAAAAAVPLTVIDHAFPAPLAALWDRPDLACGFMCGWPYARQGFRHRLVAAPLPAAARYGGRPVYATDFIVRADAPYASLPDTFGGRLAFTVTDSHSGYNAVRHHLLAWRTAGRPRLYAELIGPTTTPRRSLDSVLDGQADVAPLDSYALDLLRHHEPALRSAVRVIASTDPAPMPPLVAAPAGAGAVSDAVLDRLRAALAAVPADLLAPLCLAGFATALDPDDYRLPLTWAAEAAAAGYDIIG